ncbi:MAG: VacB/RNase II family 3'-5' exoribonuclease [Candidatus Eisenbacteria bacterium]|nr:VacB/RNase II family 3'-5' exoribonuclease [Candidatus Eisenbacteria bacterium]
MRRKMRPTPRAWRVTGRLRRSSARFGFVTTEGADGDVYVPSRHLSGALDGDEVEVEVRRNRSSGLLEGRIVRITRRLPRELTGRVRETGGGRVFIPDDPKFPSPLGIAKSKKEVCAEGDRVVATLEPRDRGDVNRCRITEVLGDSKDARLDSMIVAREFGIPTAFGARAQEEAERLADEGTGNRAELSDHRVFTIDPAEAKDFDDAVSVKELPSGSLEVGVHIADVSSVVENGGVLDIEAMDRGNSVYLPDVVFPMLPGRISNELCSLEPEKPKRCMSIMMELTRDGSLVRSRILETNVTSVRRFTYDEVQAILEGKLECPRELQRDLSLLHSLAQALKERRREGNAVDLEIPEMKVQLSEQGVPQGLYLAEHSPAHSLIEELMVLANTVVGSSIKALGVPFIFRVHPRAKKEKMEEFFRAAHVISPKVTVRPRGDFRRLKDPFEAGLDGSRKRLLDSFFVRSMEKARYDVSDVGHYGLGTESYCHFTSPIRRYADLVDHRIVRACLIRRAKRVGREIEAKLSVAAELCSEREVRADEAERTAVRVKALRFMERFLGDVLEGTIVGVINSGFFVEICGHWVEGMVPKDLLRDDSYYFDQEHFALVGKRRGTRYSLGQSLRVQIVRVEPLARMMDLLPVRE